MSNTLFLRLEGPLQSWGERGRWSQRDTAPEPTKSGIVGLLACTLGLQADEDLTQLSRQIQLGVRCDRSGVSYTDYHTIGGGYDTPQLLTAAGKLKYTPGNEPHTELTYREYLHDASFLAAVQATPELIHRLAEAVQAPYWVIYLGRKSCPPSCPLYEGVGDYPSLQTALQDWPWYCPEAKEEIQVNARTVLPDQPADGAARRRHEVISRSRRMYGPYYTQDILLKNINVIPGFPPFAPKFQDI
ncbi:MAG: type I-E CRISPR-associated protein Cas5/CasD [Anaerolineales bacterium]|nr:type I-E CRISPR-associated protein Cas5/CasD [Anaerolineales bacterium]